MICLLPLVRAESSDQAVELDISYSHAGLLSQLLCVLGIGLFLILSSIIQLSWAPVNSRTCLSGTFPSRHWNKPESTLLESRVAVILLVHLASIRIPLTHGSCSQGCHWLSHPWPAFLYLWETGPAESISWSHWPLVSRRSLLHSRELLSCLCSTLLPFQDVSE